MEKDGEPFLLIDYLPTSGKKSDNSY